MQRPRHRLARWAPPLAAIAAVCAADLIGGEDVSLISLLILGPLLASFRLGLRQTAVVGAVALVASVLLGIPDEYFGESRHLTRILPVAAAAVLCVWLSGLRRERERAAQSEHAARLSAERAERRAAETVALLDTLLARAPAGFAFIDTELRYVRINDALAAISGRVPADMVGRRVAEMLPNLPEVVDRLRSVLRTGEPVVDAEISGETSLAPGVERHWLASYYPVRGVREEILGVGAVVVEITDRKRAEVGSAYLAEATAALSASLDYEDTLRSLARLSVPHLADWCAVQVLEPDGDITTLAVAHVDEAKERLVHELNDRYPPDPDARVGSPAVIRSGRPQLYAEIDDALLQAAATDDAHLELLRDLGLRSGMTVPLIARGRALGALTFASAESGRTFGADDLALAEELGHRAGAAIENARLYRERSHIAQTLQASLLPARLPDIPGAELAARYRAAGEAVDVGGDFYDVFSVGERRWAVVMGDVLGKGASAAAMIGLARHTLRTAAMRESDSARILATLNESLYREGVEESFCTAVYAAIELDGDRLALEVTSAGHPLPLVLRADGSVEAGARPGTVLGAVPDLALEPHRVTLTGGDALVLFTDGVLEARSDDGVFGEERLRALLQSLPGVTAQGLAERVERDIVAFQAGEPRDDLAVLVVRSTAGARQARDPGRRSTEGGAELEAREGATS